MNGSFSFRLPKEIFFGTGEGRKTGAYLRAIASRFLVVTGKTAVRRYGVLAEVMESLGNESLQWEVFDEVEPEPSLRTINRALEHARGFQAEGVVSLGGGSVLDCGKAVAGLVAADSPVEPFFDGQSLPPAGVPWIAMPTTAGSGSEMTNNAVLSDPERMLKKSLRGPSLLARLVIVDPLYTEFMDPYVTATSGVDALVQAIEACTGPQVNPVVDVLSREAIRLLWTYLPEAVRAGDNRGVREYVARGSVLSAMAFSNSSSGPAHGLSHMVGPEYGIPHGEACGLFLPQVIRYNKEVLSERYRALFQTLFGDQDPGRDPVEAFIYAWQAFLDTIGLRRRLRDFGATEENLSGVVQDERIGRSIKENQRPMTHDDLIDLLREVL
ncbi:MAG TPA: iron-containing alcohol dehydrogenase [Atribacteraceae bacterium]|nr:iron-containing alcohol dehydrogenase [Atribacteraceae bacterium]